MRILDFHIHVGRSEQLTPSLISYLEHTLSPEALAAIDDMTSEKMVAMLDDHGVEKAVILSEYSPKTTGNIPSAFVADFSKGADRLIPFGTIDIDSSTDAGSQTEHYVKDLGCRGLKLLPSYTHFYPDDPRILPAYETARDLGIPVMFHTGTSLFPGSRIRYADPLLLDDIAQDFPHLKIIMSHGGRPFWYKQAEWMLTRHKNVHIDISGIPLKQFPGLFPKTDRLRDRFIFGSDWPTRPLISEYVRQIEQFPFSKETIRGILWDNGASLLGLD